MTQLLYLRDQTMRTFWHQLDWIEQSFQEIHNSPNQNWNDNDTFGDDDDDNNRNQTHTGVPVVSLQLDRSLIFEIKDEFSSSSRVTRNVTNSIQW